VAIELSAGLIQLEQKAWAEIQAGNLTTETAEAVQAAITTHAKNTGANRYEVEMELKRRVRSPEPVAD
jgi:tRNA threonylcarbamoyladenosine modification (KEOPS) complex  Pcc1 subunit